MVFYLIGHLQCSSEIAQNLAAYVGKYDTFLLCERNYRNLWQPKGLFHPIFNDQLLSIRSVLILSITILFKT